MDDKAMELVENILRYLDEQGQMNDYIDPTEANKQHIAALIRPHIVDARVIMMALLESDDISIGLPATSQVHTADQIVGYRLRLENTLTAAIEKAMEDESNEDDDYDPGALGVVAKKESDGE